MDRKLSENIILNTGYNVLSILVPFITAPYLGRILGAANIGEYTFVYSVASYFVMFGLLGIYNYGTREIAKVRDDKKKRSKVFWEIYSMQILTGLIALLCYCAYVTIITKNSSIGHYIMAFYVTTSAFDSVWYCTGVEKFRSVAARNAAIKLGNIICIFAFIHGPDDLNKYFIIMSLSYFLSAIILWPSILKEVDFIKPDWNSIKNHLKPNLNLFVPAIAASIYQTMDKIMIGAIASKSQLAYYEYADRILNIPNVVFGSIGSVMLSRMSNVLERNQTEFNSLISYSMDLSMIISVGFTFGVFAISNELVSVYYGPLFLDSGSILKILAPIVILYGWNNVLRMQYIIPKNLNSVYIISTIAGAIVNLLLNWIMIPRYAALGATIGTIAAQCTITFFYSAQIRKALPFGEYIRKNAFLLVNGFTMCVVVSLVQHTHAISIKGLIIDVVVGFMVYAVLCFVYGLTNRKHLINRIVHQITGR